MISGLALRVSMIVNQAGPTKGENSSFTRTVQLNITDIVRIYLYAFKITSIAARLGFWWPFYLTFSPNRSLNGQYTKKFFPITLVREKSPQKRESRLFIVLSPMTM